VAAIVALPGIQFMAHRDISVSVGPIAVLRAGLHKGSLRVAVVEVTDPVTPFGRAILP